MKKMKIFLTLLLLLVKTALSQTLGYIGPNGGALSQVEVVPAGPVFITDGSVLYRTTNNGNSWQPIYNQGNGIFLIRSVQPGVVYIGSSGIESDIYRSTDNGQTFTQVVTVDNMLTSIDIAPNGNVFASTYYVFNFHGQFVQDGEVQISTNNGVSWQVSNFPPLAVRDMKVNSNGVIAAATVVNGIFISANQGSSWSASTADTASALEKSSNGNFYACVKSGVKRSTNNGQTWTSINNGINVGSQAIGNAIGESSAGMIFCAFGKRLFRSSNYGDNWSLINTPDSSSINQYINSIDGRGTGELFIATSLGAYRSTDNGNSWTAINQGIESIASIALLALEPGHIFTSSYASPYVTSNNGMSWSNFLLEGELVNFNRITKKSSHIYLNAPLKGLFISNDNGSNWNNLTNGITFNSNFDAGINGTIYLCTNDSGVIRSTNNGAEWSHITNGLPAEGFAMSVIVDNLNNAYVMINPFTFPVVYEVYRSTNNGDNWTKIQDDLRLTFRGVNSSNDIFASIDDAQNPNTPQLYRSTNGGANWQLTSLVGLITALTILNNNTIYVATATGSSTYRLFKSTDNGASFSFVNTGIGNIKINALSVNSEGKLYAATSGGVYAEGAPTVLGGQNFKPEKFRLFQNYPNPFNPVTKISFEIPGRVFVSLKVYDISGKEIRTLVSGILNRGFHEIDFEAGNLSSGIYFYRLEGSGVSKVRKMVLLK
jgi:photosystem II stability/assembly factor-like uncharacterized protein